MKLSSKTKSTKLSRFSRSKSPKRSSYTEKSAISNRSKSSRKALYAFKLLQPPMLHPTAQRLIRRQKQKNEYNEYREASKEQTMNIIGIPACGLRPVRSSLPEVRPQAIRKASEQSAAILRAGAISCALPCR